MKIDILTFYIHSYFWLILIGIVLVLFFLLICSKPNIFLPLLTFIVFFQYIGYNTPYQRYLVIWDDILIFIFIFLVFIYRLTVGKIRTSPFDKYIFVFFLICIISMFLNKSQILPSLWGIKNYFQYILFFYCIINIELKKETIKKILDTITIVFILQIFIIIYQIYSSRELNVDSIYGTFPGANTLSYVTLYPIFLLIGKNDFKFKNIIDRFMFLYLLFLLIIGQGRLGILLFLLILLYIYRKQILVQFETKGFKFIIIFLIFFVGIVVYFYFTQKDLNRLLRHFDIFYQFTKAEFDVSSGSQRYLYYPLTWKILKDNGVLNLLFGLGPGMYGSFAGFKFMTPYTRYLSNVFGQIDRGFDPYVSSQVIPIWGETGFLGLIFYFLLLYKIFKFAFISYKSYNNEPLIKSLSCALIAGSFLMIIGSFFQQVFETQVLAYPYWLITGLLLKLMREKTV